jgi:High potential iron-sulfur protein
MTNKSQAPVASRRIFMMAAVGCAAAVPMASHAQKRVEEADENAVALGYKHDTTKVDGGKYPQHKADQLCNNCQFWQGSKTDEWAGCAMFGRKQIAAKGWCAAYKKVA